MKDGERDDRGPVAAAPPIPVDVLGGEAAKLRRLIERGKHRQAIERAKDAHRRLASAGSEELLATVYVAHIEDLHRRNLHAEARDLERLVEERYPSARPRLEACKIGVQIGSGDLDPLAHLARKDAPAELRDSIEAALRRDLWDLEALAGSTSLPDEHPLRIAARSLWRAFGAATSRPVTDEEIALPEVSRKSPLAPWKMLVRAVALCYRGDAEGATRALAAIESGTMPARLLPCLLVLLGQERPSRLDPASAALCASVGAAAGDLGAALHALDEAAERLHGMRGSRKAARRFVEAARGAIARCRDARPDLVSALEQLITVRAFLAGASDKDARAAVAGPTLSDARFWRLMARAAEERGEMGLACSLWEEFRRGALSEGWFPERSLEAATVYRHMAGLLHGMDREHLATIRRRWGHGYPGLRELYEDQPEHVRRAAPPPGKPDIYFLDPGRILQRAALAHPDPESYRLWHEWVGRGSRPEQADEVARLWRLAIPGDPQPLLHLMEAALRHGAFERALALCQEAERLDALHPGVRMARVRILARAALRAIKGERADEALSRVTELESMPEGKTLAAALRSLALGARDGGDLGQQLLREGLARAAGAPSPLETPLAPRPGEFARAAAAALGEARSGGIDLEIPPSWSTPLRADLALGDLGLHAAELRDLCQAALRSRQPALAYDASAHGLAHLSEGRGWFLLLRGHSLPRFASDRREACVAAAAAWAREHRDTDLLAEATRAARAGAAGPLPDAVAPASAEGFPWREVVKDELRLGPYPDKKPRRRRRSRRRSVETDDEILEMFHDSLPADLQGMPPEMLPLLMEVAVRHGDIEPEELRRRDPELFHRIDRHLREYMGSDTPRRGRSRS